MKIHKDTFRLLVASRAFRSMALIYMTLAFSLYLTVLKINIIDIGIVAALTLLFMICLVFFMGVIGDRYGYRYELLISEGFTLVGAVIIALSSDIILITLGIIIAGLSGGAGGMRGAFSPGINAMVANNYPDEKERVKKFSILTSVASLFAIFGSVMLGTVTILSKYVSIEMAYRYMFLIAAIMLSISFCLLIFMQEQKRPRKTTRIMKLSSLKYVSKVILANSLGSIGLGIAIPLLPLWFALAYKATPIQISMVFGVSYVVTAFGAYISSKLSKKINILNMSSVTRSLNGVFLIAMAFSPFFIIAGAFYIIRSFSAGIGLPSRSAINVKGVHGEDYGTATSFQGIATRVAQLSSGASGYLMDISLPFPIFIGGIFEIASGIVYKVILGDKKNSMEKRIMKKKIE